MYARRFLWLFYLSFALALPTQIAASSEEIPGTKIDSENYAWSDARWPISDGSQHGGARLSFYAYGTQDIKVAIANRDNTDNDFGYEIHLGGWNNRHSVIHKKNDTTYVDLGGGISSEHPQKNGANNIGIPSPNAHVFYVLDFIKRDTTTMQMHLQYYDTDAGQYKTLLNATDFHAPTYNFTDISFRTEAGNPFVLNNLSIESIEALFEATDDKTEKSAQASTATSDAQSAVETAEDLKTKAQQAELQKAKTTTEMHTAIASAQSSIEEKQRTIESAQADTNGFAAYTTTLTPPGPARIWQSAQTIWKTQKPIPGEPGNKHSFHATLSIGGNNSCHIGIKAGDQLVYEIILAGQTTKRSSIKYNGTELSPLLFGRTGNMYAGYEVKENIASTDNDIMRSSHQTWYYLDIYHLNGNTTLLVSAYELQNSSFQKIMQVSHKTAPIDFTALQTRSSHDWTNDSNGIKVGDVSTSAINNELRAALEKERTAVTRIITLKNEIGILEAEIKNAEERIATQEEQTAQAAAAAQKATQDAIAAQQAAIEKQTSADEALKLVESIKKLSKDAADDEETQKQLERAQQAALSKMTAAQASAYAQTATENEEKTTAQAYTNVATAQAAATKAQSKITSSSKLLKTLSDGIPADAHYFPEALGYAQPCSTQTGITAEEAQGSVIGSTYSWKIAPNNQHYWNTNYISTRADLVSGGSTYWSKATSNVAAGTDPLRVQFYAKANSSLPICLYTDNQRSQPYILVLGGSNNTHTVMHHGPNTFLITQNGAATDPTTNNIGIPVPNQMVWYRLDRDNTGTGNTVLKLSYFNTVQSKYIRLCEIHITGTPNFTGIAISSSDSGTVHMSRMGNQTKYFQVLNQAERTASDNKVRAVLSQIAITTKQLNDAKDALIVAQEAEKVAYAAATTAQAQIIAVKKLARIKAMSELPPAPLPNNSTLQVINNDAYDLESTSSWSNALIKSGRFRAQFYADPATLYLALHNTVDEMIDSNGKPAAFAYEVTVGNGAFIARHYHLTRLVNYPASEVKCPSQTATGRMPVWYTLEVDGGYLHLSYYDKQSKTHKQLVSAGDSLFSDKVKQYTHFSMRGIMNVTNFAISALESTAAGSVAAQSAQTVQRAEEITINNPTFDWTSGTTSWVIDDESIHSGARITFRATATSNIILGLGNPDVTTSPLGYEITIGAFDNTQIIVTRNDTQVATVDVGLPMPGKDTKYELTLARTKEKVTIALSYWKEDGSKAELLSIEDAPEDLLDLAWYDFTRLAARKYEFADDYTINFMHVAPLAGSGPSVTAKQERNAAVAAANATEQARIQEEKEAQEKAIADAKAAADAEKAADAKAAADAEKAAADAKAAEEAAKKEAADAANAATMTTVDSPDSDAAKEAEKAAQVAKEKADLAAQEAARAQAASQAAAEAVAAKAAAEAEEAAAAKAAAEKAAKEKAIADAKAALEVQLKKDADDSYQLDTGGEGKYWPEGYMVAHFTVKGGGGATITFGEKVDYTYAENRLTLTVDNTGIKVVGGKVVARTQAFKISDTSKTYEYWLGIKVSDGMLRIKANVAGAKDPQKLITSFSDPLPSLTHYTLTPGKDTETEYKDMSTTPEEMIAQLPKATISQRQASAKPTSYTLAASTGTATRGGRR